MENKNLSNLKVDFSIEHKPQQQTNGDNIYIWIKKAKKKFSFLISRIGRRRRRGHRTNVYKSVGSCVNALLGSRA